jgi:signal peptidase I
MMAEDTAVPVSADRLHLAYELIQTRLASGELVRFTVPTGSMLPALCLGDRVSVRGFRAEEARPGDIVVSRIGTGWRVHRLIESYVESRQLFFITKGDQMLYADEPSPVQDWVGLVVAIQAQGRELNQRTSAARTFNRALAFLSRSQWAACRRPPTLLRRAAVKGLSLALHVGGYVARNMA